VFTTRPSDLLHGESQAGSQFFLCADGSGQFLLIVGVQQRQATRVNLTVS
jgi:hypothetical protein